MTYAPNSTQIYIQAYAGAQSGMGASGRMIVDPSAVPNGTADVSVNNALVAGAYAQEYDTLFAASGLPVDCYSTEATKVLSAGVFWERNPVLADPAQSNVVTPTSYAVPILGILSMIAAAETYIAGQGISIPSCCCDGSAPVTNDPNYESADTTGPVTVNAGFTGIVNIAGFQCITSGDLLVMADAQVGNDNEVTIHSLTPRLIVTPSVGSPQTYTATAVGIPIESANEVSIVWTFGGLPTNIDLEIQFELSGGSGTDVTIGQHGAQLTVYEMPPTTT